MSDENINVCAYCMEEFRHRHTLSRHLRVVHDVGSSKDLPQLAGESGPGYTYNEAMCVYDCKGCDNCFYSLSGVINHLIKRGPLHTAKVTFRIIKHDDQSGHDDKSEGEGLGVEGTATLAGTEG